MEGTSQQLIPIFDGDNYDFWRIKMTTIFKTRKLWTVVENGVSNRSAQEEQTPEALRLRNQREEETTKDLTALQILQTAVSDQIFSRIAPAVTSKEAWDALKTEFQGTPQVRLIKLQSLRREYENLKMDEGENITVFTEKLIDLGNQLRVNGEEKTDYQIVQKILISLPERFDSIVAVMEQTKDLTSLSVTELIGTLKAHEKRVSIREERSTEGAFYGENKSEVKRQKSAEKWCGVCKRNNHNESDCWMKKNKGVVPQQVANNERKCFVCNKPGHLAKNCKLRRTERVDLSIEETEDDSEDEGHMLFSAVEEEVSSKGNDETWLVDSGCTNHMTKEVKYFITLDQGIKVPIKVGNGQRVMTAGKGNIQVMTSQGEKIIKEVFLVPGLARNLLSVSQMISKGYGVLFEDKRCLINDPQGRRILNIKMKHKSFPFRWSKRTQVPYLRVKKKSTRSRFEELRRKLGVKPRYD
ncbi:Zinc finger CCHC-type [Arabidopsis thaliana x Arabidopsis arenosa]|uniref:Zinc finger CCHC-type n=1 Tax=Arabidopsis thaliana x Arabidopsis arenosa TaxID=1240361 RepID=A0A8T2B1C2_9BRAS|nr:Zinc finger CCHC-type [Arabidopsis thaliana x Arabidopsis arenosa]